MLFFLTGDIQTGKTRWLQALIAELEAAGVCCAGVIAPGIWREHEGGFEKLGITNELLPSHETITFAQRADLAQQNGTFNAGSQAGQAKLGWAIDDAAIAQVNAHFAHLQQQEQPQKTLLIVDELGQLELKRGGGLTEAVALLDEGPSEQMPHAIVIVRDWLLPLAQERLEPVWGPSTKLSPSEACRGTVLRVLLGEQRA